MDQRKVYWKTRAWRYRNPEANEPSDTALALSRAGMFVSAVALLIVAGIIKAADELKDYSTEQVASVAFAAAYELEKGTTSGLGSSYETRSVLYKAVNEEGKGNVEIRSVGDGRYELTNRDDENPVCLTVTVANEPGPAGDDKPGSPSITTSVDERSC